VIQGKSGKIVVLTVQFCHSEPGAKPGEESAFGVVIQEKSLP
jgi:hypothetical protein